MQSKVPIALGEIVELKKAHPCGGNAWIVRRVGADVRLECSDCGHKVMMSRADFERRYRRHAEASGGRSGGGDGDG